MARTPLDSSPDSSPDNPLDIADAAARLGLSTETVRKRLQRGKLKGYKTADGSWRVVLPSLDSPGQQPGQRPGQESNPSPDNRPDGSGALVDALRDEVAFLRSQLQARDDEIRRAHILLQQVQQQSTALLSKPQLPWWRRWIGRR